MLLCLITELMKGIQPQTTIKMQLPPYRYRHVFHRIDAIICDNFTGKFPFWRAV